MKGTKGQEDPHSMKESTASGSLDAVLTSWFLFHFFLEEQERTYYFGSPLPLKSQPKLPDRHDRYLLLSVSNKIKFKKHFH